MSVIIRLVSVVILPIILGLLFSSSAYNAGWYNLDPVQYRYAVVLVMTIYATGVAVGELREFDRKKRRGS